MSDNYLEINRKLWNKKTPIHLKSEFYNNQAFLNGESSLKTPELHLLGDVSGKSVLHLQCHFGQDSLSLARMGANVTGLDLSDKSIEAAKLLNEQLQLDAEFVCCDVYSARNFIDKQFDIVFTSYGTIGWLPDMDHWASVVSHFLKPRGTFVFVDFHPVVWMFDSDFKRIHYPYFNNEPIIEKQEGTYANKDAAIELTEVGWNHSIAEVLNALLKNGLKLELFDEYDYSSYPCFKHMETIEKDRYRIKHHGNKLPLMYSIKMTK